MRIYLLFVTVVTVLVEQVVHQWLWHVLSNIRVCLSTEYWLELSVSCLSTGRITPQNWCSPQDMLEIMLKKKWQFQKVNIQYPKLLKFIWNLVKEEKPAYAVLPSSSVYRTCSVFTEQLQNYMYVLQMVLYVQNHYRTIGWQHCICPCT